MFLNSNNPRSPCARSAASPVWAAVCRDRGAVLVAACLAVCIIKVPIVAAATVESSNFRVTAANNRIAEDLALTAEDLREELAREWLGEELPRWTSPCIVLVQTDADRMTGDTTYEFGGGHVRRWRMTLRGPLERIVESLLPHEIAHTVLASHFRRAIPRWADEGVALMAEDEVDRRRVRALANSFLESGERIALQAFLDADEYPADRQRMRVLYAQASSFTEFLVQAGKQRFLQFVAVGIDHGWAGAAESTYGFSSLTEAERCWREWEAQGRPEYAIGISSSLADAARESAPRATSARSIADGADASSDTSRAGIRRAASMPDPAGQGTR